MLSLRTLLALFAATAALLTGCFEVPETLPGEGTRVVVTESLPPGDLGAIMFCLGYEEGPFQIEHLRDGSVIWSAQSPDDISRRPEPYVISQMLDDGTLVSDSDLVPFEPGDRARLSFDGSQLTFDPEGREPQTLVCE